MNIYLKEDVYEAALDRIRYIFDEFENVTVCFSGGKDSTVTLEMSLIVAREKNRLPLNVMFLDQEGEWQAVVDYVEYTANRDEIDMSWLQIPIKLFNATSASESWLHCWEEGVEWIHPKNPNSIQENVYGTDRFHNMFPAFQKYHYPDEPHAFLGGVRCEESPARRTGLTDQATYKWVTWGKQVNRNIPHYTFYPLYDWGWRDIWKSIHDNQWSYCKIYDEFYRYGISPIKMRVSNLHHETAVSQLFYLQELEGDTWDRLTKRLSGINQARHFSQKDMYTVKEVPFMFSGWRDYRDYLAVHLNPNPDMTTKYLKEFKRMDIKWGGMSKLGIEAMYKCQIQTLLANDYEFTKLQNFESRPQTVNYRKFAKNEKVDWGRDKTLLTYIPEESRIANG